MIGQELSIGDTVVFPDGGGSRFGGPYLRAGAIVSMTEQRISIEAYRLDSENKTIKRTSKTPAKVLLWRHKTS
jgi:hypothetical protein